MKFLFIISLLSFIFQSFGEEKLEIDSSVEGMLSLYASEIKNCDVDELGISSFNDVKNICKSLVESKVCSDIRPEYLVDCNNLVSDANEIELQESSDSLWDECIVGMNKSSGLKTTMLPISALTHKEFRGDAWSAESLDNSRATWNYYRAEEDRLNEEDSVWSTLSTIAFSDDRKRELEHGCLNKKGRWKVRCNFIAGMITHVTLGLGVGGAVTGAGALGGSAVAGVTPFFAGVEIGTDIATGIDANSRTGKIVGATVGAGVGLAGSIVSAPVTIPVGAVVGGVAGAGTWLSSFIAGIKMLPQDAMRGVKKESSFDKNSSSAGE